MAEAREKCAVFGVFAPGKDVSRIIYYGLFALQHRGQESSGMAVATPSHVTLYKNMGLVQQVFNESILQLLKGHAGIGHNRYSTTGSSLIENAQPYLFDNYASEGKSFAVAHNGNLVNTVELANEVEKLGLSPRSTSDTELFGLILEKEYRDRPFVEALLATLNRISGAYSLAILTRDELYAVRDPLGFRPLVLGEISGGYAVASESAAFPIVGGKFIREIEPGEIVRINEKGVESIRFAEGKYRFCMFEFFYFSRPDALLRGKEAYSMRIEMGRLLAREAPVPADIVVHVPDSGLPAAIGYSLESGIPHHEALIKNRYVGRTFIQPLQTQRDVGVRMKLNPLREILEGKRVVLVDDSIVRGSTSRQIVRLLKSAGAKEVHMRLSSPPIRFPCYYGIDFGTYEELIAANLSVQEICEQLGADSLHYLSLESVVKATGFPFEDFCLACFNNDRPIPIPEQMKIGKYVLEEKK